MSLGLKVRPALVFGLNCHPHYHVTGQSKSISQAKTPIAPSLLLQCSDFFPVHLEIISFKVKKPDLPIFVSPESKEGSSSL